MEDKIEYEVEWCVGLVPYFTERRTFPEKERKEAKAFYHKTGKKFEYVTFSEVCTRKTVLFQKPALP